MDSSIVISFSRNEVLNLFAIWRNHKNFSFTWFLHNLHVFTSSSATLFTMWLLVDIMGLLSCDSLTSCSLKSNMVWIVCCPFFHKSPPNCTFGYNWNLDEFEDWASLWHWANRLKRGSPRWGYFTMIGSFCCHLYQPQPKQPSGGTLWLWSWGPCQSANINLFNIRKMPNASRTRCRDTDELSLALSRKINEN